jgi:hypothetical protein
MANHPSPSSGEVGVALNFTTPYNNYTDYPPDASLLALNVTAQWVTLRFHILEILDSIFSPETGNQD